MYTTTFVTALFQIYDTPSVVGKTLEKRLAWFARLASSGIPIHLFVDLKSAVHVVSFLSHTNIFITLIDNLENTWTYSIFAPYKTKLPPIRLAEKDTFEYITLMNAKTEFVDCAARANIFNTPQFAWIDFNIFHVIKNVAAAMGNLKKIASCRLAPSVEILFPGCWESGRNHDQLWKSINWRFCGTFHIGTREGVMDMQQRIVNNISNTLYLHDVIVWEVNIWAYLENESDWKPCWYASDHNDRLLEIQDMYLKN